MPVKFVGFFTRTEYTTMATLLPGVLQLGGVDEQVRFQVAA